MATRVSSFSAMGSSVILPVLRCETRVASSWNDTYAQTFSSAFSPESKPVSIVCMRARSSSSGSTPRVTSR